MMFIKRPPNEEFANRLKSLMKSKGFDPQKRQVSKFAQKIGKRESTVHRWINGGVPTLINDIDKLCEFFDVSADFLLRGKSVDIKNQDKNNFITILKIPNQEFILKVKIESAINSEEKERNQK